MRLLLDQCALHRSAPPKFNNFSGALRAPPSFILVGEGKIRFGCRWGGRTPTYIHTYTSHCKSGCSGYWLEEVVLLCNPCGSQVGETVIVNPCPSHVLKVCPGQGGVSQGIFGESGSCLASRDSSNASGWKQSKENRTASSVAGPHA